MGTSVSFACGTDVVPSWQMLAVTLLADPAFEEELRIEFPWITAGIQTISRLTSGLMFRNEDQDTTKFSYDSIQPYLSCLELAAENRDPFKLEGILRFIHQFECMDKRDRLYGTLALIEWRNHSRWKQNIPRPTPDYEKNAFRLAAEVFCTLTPGGIETIGYALSWVQQLFEVFGLDPADQAIIQALMERYTTPVRVGLDGEDDGEQSHDRTEDLHWRSMRICGSSSPEAREQYNLHCAEPTAGEQFVTLFDHDNMPFAHAPPQTSVGDFYIEMDRWYITPKSWATLGIIVQGTPKLFQKQNHHSLLGLARRCPSQTGLSKRAYYSHEQERYKFVNLYWDVDDIFLLYLSTLFQDHIDAENLVLIRLCNPGRKDSSFARFSW
jgi:hypothetical protein